MKRNYLSKRYFQIFFHALVGACELAFYTTKKLSKAPRSIVVVQTAQLGDMICTTPVFRAIKKHLPDTRLIVVGSKAAEGMLLSNTDIDHYIVFDQKNSGETARLLRRESAEAGIVVVPSLDSLLLLADAHIPFIVAPKLVHGENPANTRLYRFLCRFIVTQLHRFGTYAPGEYLKLLEPFGIEETDTTKRLSYTDQARKNIEKILTESDIDAQSDFVCIAPGAGNKVKQWPPERFAEVADYISKKFGSLIVLLGSSVDQEEVHLMIGALSKEVAYIDTCAKLSFDEIKALISRARLLIAADTMAIYIAEAFNVPLIDIAGPVAPNEQPPKGKNRIVLVPPYDYVPQLHIMNARVYDAAEARRQVMSITAEMVKNAAATLLS